MKKIVYFVLFSLLVTFFYLSVNNTYSLFTKKIDKTGSINTIKNEATFLPGTDFNAKIKQLAGNNGANSETNDSNITSIVKSNKLTIVPTSNNIVSTNDSPFPIYAWFDNGIIYYYSEVSNLYMNVNSSTMFSKLSNTTTIDLTSINTSRVQNMSNMFYYSTGITSLNVSNFNTSNVQTMNRMFTRISVTNLDLSSFDTSKVTDMNSMFSQDGELQTITLNFNTSLVTDMGSLFYDCHSLKKLDLSSFDLNKLTASGNMLHNMTALEELKTPKVYPTNTNVTILLPKTMYDENQVGYITLGKSTNPVSPTEIWLKEGYTVSFDANGGSVSIASKIVRKNEEYGQLPIPTRTGYTFLGWTNENHVTKWDSLDAWNNNIIRLTNSGYWSSIQYRFNTNEVIDFDLTLNDANVLKVDIMDIEVSSNLYTNTGNRVYGSIAITSAMRNKYPTYKFIDINTDVTSHDYVINKFIIKTTENTINQINDSHTLIAKWEPNTYTVSFDKGNLLYGLEHNQSEISNGDRMKYSITNDVIEVTSLRNDGWGSTTGKVYLTANTQYVFNLQTDGTWGGSGDTVESFLLYNNSTSSGDYIYMPSPNNYSFTPTKTGLYTLRLDVNSLGETYHFWNISVKEKNMETKDVIYASTYGTLPTPSKRDFGFIEWNTSEDGTGSTITSSITVNITQDTVLYAKWSPIITLNENINYLTTLSTRISDFDGSTNKCMQVGDFSTSDISYGDELVFDVDFSYTNLEALDNYYMLFQCRGNVGSWNKQHYNSSSLRLIGSGTKHFSYSFKIDNLEYDENQYYRCQLRTDYYTNGVINLSNIKVRKISNQSLDSISTNQGLPTPTRLGYTFTGWNTSEDGTGNSITNNMVSTIINPKTLYAQWSANTYTINFDSNGGDTPNPESKTLTYGTTLGSNPVNIFTNNTILPNNKLSSDQMSISFVDDNTSPSGKAIRIERTATGTAPYAGYYLSFNGSNGLAVGQTYAIKVKVKGKGNWLLGPEQYNNLVILNDLTDEYKDYLFDIVTDNRTNRAIVHYAVSYYDSDAYVQFQPIEILAYMPTVGKAGYDFAGWYTSSTGGTQVTKDSLVPPSNTTYYAHWTPRTTTVTFDPTGGSVSPTTKTVTYDSTYDQLPIPTRTNYSFLGWNTNINGTREYVDSSSIVKNYRPFTIYAIWQDNTSLIAGKTWEFDYNGTNGLDGTSQRFIPPVSGTYKIELWGAQGGITEYSIAGGLGGYTKGNVSLTPTDNLYLFVGGTGSSTTIGKKMSVKGGYNGGGATGGQACCGRSYGSGGGATDVRIVDGLWNDFNSLKSRIMVSAGGGGAFSSRDTNGSIIDDIGGAAGGLNGANGFAAYGNGAYCLGQGATQTLGGAIYANCSHASEYAGGSVTGGFGYGGGLDNHASTGGGSGYYGGSKSGHVASAGGGSSFISGYSGCDAISSSSTSTNIVHTGQPNHYSGLIFNTGTMEMIDGNGCDWSTGVATNCGSNQIQPDGTTTTGHTGNGYARITLISLD